MRGILVPALLFSLTGSAVFATAAEQSCSYQKSVRQGGIIFNVTSRPAGGCTVQILTISAIKGSKKVASVKADVDYLASSAQAVDLTGDAKPELIVISKTSGGFRNEKLDVYYFEGNNLHRASIPELEDKNGYRGGDSFHLDGRQIVRSLPVYLDGDKERKPSGGVRTLRYNFSDGRLSLYTQTAKESSAPASAPLRPPAPPAQAPAAKADEDSSRYRALSQPAIVPANKRVAASKSELVEIKVEDDGIELLTNGAVENFKVIKLDNPQRIAVDIPGASSKLAGKKIGIDKFGISRARVGLNKGFLRIVLDPSQNQFPKYSVNSSKSGLTVKFSR